MKDWADEGAPRPLIGEGRCRGRLTGGVEAGGRSKGRGFATSFDFPPAEISGLYLGKFPQTPLCKSDVGDVGGEAAPGRLLTPASSSPVRCPRQRCALLPKQKKHSGARRGAQDEGLG